jgi:hypothetical protein
MDDLRQIAEDVLEGLRTVFYPPLMLIGVWVMGDPE